MAGRRHSRWTSIAAALATLVALGGVVHLAAKARRARAEREAAARAGGPAPVAGVERPDAAAAQGKSAPAGARGTTDAATSTSTPAAGGSAPGDAPGPRPAEPASTPVRDRPLPLTAEGTVDFAALGLTGKEPGAELLRTEERVREAPIEPDFRVGESWTVESYYRETQTGTGERWSDAVLWRFEIAREDELAGEPCLVFEVRMVDATGAEVAGQRPSIFYVGKERYDLLAARLSEVQGGKLTEHTVAYAPTGGPSMATGTIVPFDLPARGATARVVAPGRELPRLEPIAEHDRAKLPGPHALVGAGADSLIVELRSPLDGTLVRQRWAPADRRWPVASEAEHRRSYRRR